MDKLVEEKYKKMSECTEPDSLIEAFVELMKAAGKTPEEVGSMCESALGDDRVNTDKE